MLARRSTLNHPQSVEIELPLLVPAFSSKGFKLTAKEGGRDSQYSETAYELAEFGKYGYSSVLVSAYDLHFRHFDAPNLPPVSGVQEYLRNVDVVFVDSGGYELVSDFDSAEVKTFAYASKSGYGSEQYRTVLQQLTSLEDPLPIVVANFDYESRGNPIKDQLEAARALFDTYRGCLTSFILKPWTKDGSVVDPTRLSRRDFADLDGFDIIGVTEKELGRDLFTRLKRVAELRRGLNEANISSPIHVWGGLDPVMTPLYYFAGAEIFDGISWLRYAYRNGIAVNRECHSILSEDIGVNASRTENDAFASLRNVRYLDDLSGLLQQWYDSAGTDFSMFHPDISSYLERSYKAMVTRIALLKETA